MKSKGTRTWTAIVASAAIVSGVALPAEGLLDRWPMFAALVGLAFAADGIGIAGLLPGISVAAPLAAFVEKAGAAARSIV